ncbi:hypothetical protein AMIS_32080 [Actinoplanes missouriensis 431]|uniref:Uncharacterized protein n=1 Tax=Actinoplanes missouriensis (strain ATCC 14538 / DSM 43046 / CBS 188.64 / JCM 3121 / NBRC 102363 / NCIMB 12654 / NRRL B-3342 / UNCC 431) TaxID=512565 RepID=I0H5Z1_ACTM4|nr:hypothetical protein [Actinoplanes missouriensis]BAL88428.1 hypothetical protein AMIS_32080 [Actinoplanes missouriensis 431]
MRADGERFPPLTRSQRYSYAADPDVLRSDMAHLADPGDPLPPASPAPHGSVTFAVVLLALCTVPPLLLLVVLAVIVLP